MKHTIYSFMVLLTVFLCSSCEKVIDVKVEDADKKYVIEGVLTNEAGGCVVKISKTKSISENNSVEGVSGATVRITDPNGAVTNLVESGKGMYAADLIGKPGVQYTLQVNVGAETFRATSLMPQKVNIDSLYISKMDMMGEDEYYTNVVFADPQEKGNAYRFVQYHNGTKGKDIFIQNDDLSNGRKNTTNLFGDDLEMKKGDLIKVQMQSIDPVVYKYWFSLWQGATGEGNSASPANPVTNISGGALGYFSAHAISEQTLVVP